MSDIGHEDTCSCANCQPQAVTIRQLKRDLAQMTAQRNAALTSASNAMAELQDAQSHVTRLLAENQRLESELAAAGEVIKDLRTANEFLERKVEWFGIARELAKEVDSALAKDIRTRLCDTNIAWHAKRLMHVIGNNNEPANAPDGGEGDR